ncbi:MAG TPA: alpha/beta fold hydrolase [Solimonas sp.]|nr:alpha/beta fold hydrolase [Solimonas sp.]
MMKTPVVLIHGMWCTAADWTRVRELLAPRGYDCHVPTLPAHEPTADQPLRVGDKSLRDYLAFLEDYIRQQNFERPPVLIGHSMGGLLAQQLAARINPFALVLLTPVAPWGLNSVGAGNLGVALPAFSRWGFWRRPYKPTPQVAARHAHNGLSGDRQKKYYERMVHESGRVAYEIALWWADWSKASAVEASAVRCPVYVVSCGEDGLTPAFAVRKVAGLYPQAAHRHYPQRGHWVIDDDETEEMIHGICGWLRPLEQRALRGQQPPR